MIRELRVPFLLAVILVLPLTGCAGYSQAAFTAKDLGERRIFQNEAEEGDAEAQYRLGDSWCCSIGRPTRIHNNQTATEWLCKSAHQNFSAAQLELARIYAGRPFQYNSMKRLIEKAKGAPTNLPAALMWARLAQSNQNDDAADLIKTISAEMSADELARTDDMLKTWSSQPCTWDQVIVQTN